jgi:hypothetical protein
MLTIGLLVEAGILPLSTFEDVDNEFDWALVYPRINGKKLE